MTFAPRLRRRRRGRRKRVHLLPPKSHQVETAQPADRHEDERGRQIFFEYYARQRLLTGGSDEWRAFSASLRLALPITFRQVRFVQRADESEKCWQEGMRLVAALEKEIGHVGTKLPWCRGYQLALGRQQLREAVYWSPAAAAVQCWLVSSSISGLIVRQEIVSMLPSALLNPLPGEIVLDMCAAPGSKASQLLERVVAPTHQIATSGFLVANDVSPERAYIIASKLKALGSCAFAVCTGRGQTHPVGGYNCIVCDVPCSGDGTLRKDGSLWAKWRPGLGLRLHSLQLQLALRAASLLRVGGRMAYSTCTFNPIEDEAVVGSLIAATGGSLEIVDASSLLPGVECSRGLTNWQVVDDSMTRIPSFNHASTFPRHERRRIRRTMFAVG